MDIFNIKNIKNYRMELDNNFNPFYPSRIYTGSNIRHSTGNFNNGKN